MILKKSSNCSDGKHMENQNCQRKPYCTVNSEKHLQTRCTLPGLLSVSQSCSEPTNHVCIHAQSCPTLCNPLTVAHQAPLSVGFPKQGYWSRLPFPPPEDIPNPGIELTTPVLPALQADSLPLSRQGSPEPTNQQSSKTQLSTNHSMTSPQGQTFPSALLAAQKASLRVLPYGRPPSTTVTAAWGVVTGPRRGHHQVSGAGHHI